MRKIYTLLGIVLGSVTCHAGVFSLPHFVDPESLSIGLEPELTFTGGAGIGVNAKFTKGVSDLVNWNFLIGTGEGPKKFRIGGGFVFDFFPDLEDQPGLGLGIQSVYYKRKDFNQLELTAIPYLHKTFVGESGDLEPFVALPVGLGFRSDQYVALFGVSVGAIIRTSESLLYILELGINVQHTDTYLSGGLVYYY